LIFVVYYNPENDLKSFFLMDQINPKRNPNSQTFRSISEEE